MNIDLKKASSRTLGVAQSLVGEMVDAKLVYSKSVVLTGESDILLTKNGHWCFMNSLRLLARVVGQLTICLPPGLANLEQEARQCCSETYVQGTIRFVISEAQASLPYADAILNVGLHVVPSLPWTSIASNGWVARVSSGSQDLPPDITQPNPIAALMAASLGVTEVFKRIFGVPSDVAPMLDKAELSLFDFTTEPNSCGPALPDNISLPDTLLIGGGAIGNGIALLMSQLPLSGKLHIVDKQNYQDENLGTSVLLAKNGWVGLSKAERLAQWLLSNSGLDATGEKSFINDALATEKVKSMTVDLVLSGLDNVQARHESQLAWPSLMIDGGISETGAAVVQHRLDERGLACIRCSFKLPQQDIHTMQQQLTGLNTSSLANQGRLLTEEDIVEAAPNKQEWLRVKLKEKRTICSIVSEAGLQSLGVNAEEGFQPSVPFVATAAAAMVVAEALKALLFPDAPYPQRFVVGNLFLGPESTAKVNRYAEPSCFCVSKRGLINSIRQKRHLNRDGRGSPT